MTNTIEDLKTDAEFADSMVAYWEATREYHAAESQKAHLEFIKALEDRTKAHNKLVAFNGASS
jgi:hypothetical protein